ncbi:AAA family ATPase [candidate division KSB1 bacterium]|nr:AAA family ATPase [candidate division KSB1 bacterium]
MYLDLWDFKRNPFDSIPAFDNIYIPTSFSRIVARLDQGLNSREQFALVTGNYGVGKTSFINFVNQVFDSGLYKRITITNPRNLTDDFYRVLISGLDANRSSYDSLSDIQQLYALFETYSKQFKQLLIIIDDAHFLQEIAIFERLNSLLNYYHESAPFIYLLLVGLNEFKTVLPRLPFITNKLAFQNEISNYNLKQTHEYISHCLSTAGANYEIFNSAVIKEINRFAEGNPQIINSVCEKCLLKATEKKQRIIDLDFFEQFLKFLIKPKTIRFMEDTSQYNLQRKLLSDKFSHVRNNEPFYIKDILKQLEKIIEQIQTDNEILKKALEQTDAPFDLSTHSTNVSIIAGYMAAKAGMTHQQNRMLMLAALFHDIGMTLIPPQNYLHSKVLSVEEKDKLKMHPVIGSKIIKRLVQGIPDNVRTLLATIVLQEHEREGGIGYPYQLKGDQIHEYARQISICDTFESLIHTRPWRKRVHPTAAIK